MSVARTAAGLTDEAVRELAEAGVATVYEAAGRRGLLDVEWLSITPGRRVAGPARTALCGQGDNRAVHEVMAHLQPGEVLVLTMPEPEPVALLGDLLATQAVTHGAVGVLVDAAVRDSAELATLECGVWARWRRARGATKSERGRVNVPVRVGGTTIAPGDLVILDDDGAAAVPADEVDRVRQAVAQRVDKENGLRERWAAGELSYDAYGMRAADARTVPDPQARTPDGSTDPGESPSGTDLGESLSDSAERSSRNKAAP